MQKSINLRQREVKPWKSERVAMVVSMLQSFIFPPPPSLFITAMSVVSLTLLVYTGFSEVRGNHLKYSKFWNVNSPKSGRKQIKVSSTTGMLILYTPAFLAALTSFLLFPPQDFRSLLLHSALAIHFFKRIFEVQLQSFTFYFKHKQV